MAARTTEGFCLVQGPPGTGKTSTILGMLSAFLERRKGTRVLLCTSRHSALRNSAKTPILTLIDFSNAAVDEIASRILNQGLFASIDPEKTGMMMSGTQRTDKAHTRASSYTLTRVQYHLYFCSRVKIG